MGRYPQISILLPRASEALNMKLLASKSARQMCGSSFWDLVICSSFIHLHRGRDTLILMLMNCDLETDTS